MLRRNVGIFVLVIMNSIVVLTSSVTPLVAEEIPSKYAQEYAAVVQNMESSINKRKNFLAQFSCEVPPSCSLLFTLIDMTKHVYEVPSFNVAQAKDNYVQSLSSLISSQFHSVCKKAGQLSSRKTDFYLATAQEFPVFHGLVEELADNNNIPCPLVVIAENEHLFSVSSDSDWQKRSVIVISAGLLSQLSDEGLEAVVLNQIYKVVHRQASHKRFASELFSYESVRNLLMSSLAAEAGLSLGMIVDVLAKSSQLTREYKAFLSVFFIKLGIVASAALYKSFYDEQCANEKQQAYAFVDQQLSSGADGLAEVSIIIGNEQQKNAQIYNKLFDQYYQDYIAQPNHSKKAAIQISSLIEKFS